MEISKRTLERRLQEYGLRQNPEYDIDLVTAEEVRQMLVGPG